MMYNCGDVSISYMIQQQLTQQCEKKTDEHQLIDSNKVLRPQAVHKTNLLHMHGIVNYTHLAVMTGTGTSYITCSSHSKVKRTQCLSQCHTF